MEKKLLSRKHNRLSNFDYSSKGYYFLTLCTNGNKAVFGVIKTENNLARLNLSKIGRIVEIEIDDLSNVYDNIYVDKYVVMPNHIHMILVISDSDASGRTQFAPTISRVVKQFKGSLTKRIGYSVWQKSFYDHVIRSEEEYLRIWQYIDENPARWSEDKYYINCD